MKNEEIHKRGINATFFIATIFCLAFLVSASYALAEESAPINPEEKGTIEGIDKDFAITDSDYFNISLHSSEEVKLILQSIPKIIVLKISAVDDGASNTEIKISGMNPDITYHKYEDDYRNYVPILADENGTFSFQQDISEDHLIFIQPKKSTVIITNDVTGGDCTDVGNWDSASKTCTLNEDISDTVQISSDGITLDGNNHVVSPSISKNGIYILGSRVIVKNVTVKNSAYGIYQYRGGFNTYENNNLVGNSYGIQIDYDVNSNILRNNTISNSAFSGLTISSSNNLLRGNKMMNNLGYGFFISGTNIISNDVDDSNTVDDRPIYFLKNQDGGSFEAMDMGGFFCFNCNGINIKGNKFSKNSLIYLSNTNNSTAEYQSDEKTIEFILTGAADNIIKNNSFTRIRLLNGSSNNKIYNNNIGRVSNVVLISGSSGNTFNEDLPTGGNYWETNIYCHDLDNDRFCDAPYTVKSPSAVDYHPYAKQIDNTIPDPVTGNSNVLFLPGLEASRLYKDGLINNDELWVPTIFSNDMQQLLLNENGQSIENIFTNTDGVIESAGGNIYKTFADKLRSLKSDGTINDFNLFAYDWRQSVEDIAQSGTPYAGSVMRSATTEAKALALTSKSKKVTIVAHSNGGLLAKAIMLKLREEGKEDLVDKIIFVASPQMGTPRAITSMLYGHDEGLVSGLLTTDAEMRTLAENMSGAYGLLPSKTYLDRLEDPMIKFNSENTRYKAFKDAYGDDITKNEYDQFTDFLLSKVDGREKPDADDTDLENVLNENLLQQAKEMHERLDAWTPSVNTKVYEIAGWGLDTIRGVEYKEEEKKRCSLLSAIVPFCGETVGYEPYYDPKFTVDGDKVVVASSALMFENADNVKRYWVDLYRNNGTFKIEMEHSNILEINAVDNFVLNILTGENVDLLPDYISLSRPEDYANAKPRLRMSLYSPLDIHLRANGKHTGPITIEENGQHFKSFEEQIPNSSYYQFGDRKYVGIPTGENMQLEMNGYDSGSYTLKIEEVRETENGEEIVAQTSFANLPVSPNTKVTLDIPEAGLENMPNLKADYDGDGNNDYEAAVVLGGEAQIVDNVKPTIEITNLEAKEYLNNQTIDFIYDAIDNLSQKDEIAVQTYLNGQQTSENKIDLAMLNLGSHIIKITATDKAGNIQEKEITFSTTTNLQAIKDNIQKYYDAKLIKSKQQKNVLLVSLDIIEQRLEFLEMIENNQYISQKAKSIIRDIVRKQIGEHVEFLIKQVNHQQRFYDAETKQLLIEDFEWLGNNAIK